MRRGQVGCDKAWRRLRFPNEKGSRTSGYSLRLKVGELVTTTELTRFQETTRVFSTVKTFFFFFKCFYTNFVINKDIFCENWETGLSRVSGIYFRILKALSIYLAMLENPLQGQKLLYLYSWVIGPASVKRTLMLPYYLKCLDLPLFLVIFPSLAS